MYRIRTAITGGPGGSELNTMYFNDSLSLTAQDAADAVTAFWNTIKGAIHTAYTLKVETDVTIVADFTGVPTGNVTVTSSAVTGTDSGQPLPGATQGLLKLSTGVYYGGRQLQGKIWIPGPTESNNATGVPVGTYETLVNGAAATLIGDADSELFVWSRKYLNANGVIGASLWDQWGVLRSRRQ